MIPVSPEQAEAINQMYIATYKNELENPEDLTSEDAWLITSLIYQDLLFVAGNFFQANNYRKGLLLTWE